MHEDPTVKRHPYKCAQGSVATCRGGSSIYGVYQKVRTLRPLLPSIAGTTETTRAAGAITAKSCVRVSFGGATRNEAAPVTGRPSNVALQRTGRSLRSLP